MSIPKKDWGDTKFEQLALIDQLGWLSENTIYVPHWILLDFKDVPFYIDFLKSYSFLGVFIHNSKILSSCIQDLVSLKYVFDSFWTYLLFLSSHPLKIHHYVFNIFNFFFKNVHFLKITIVLKIIHIIVWYLPIFMSVWEKISNFF